MLLVVDVGNSQTTLGLFDDGELGIHWRVSTDPRRTADEYRIWLQGLFDHGGIDPGGIDGVALASVVPSATVALRAVAQDLTEDGPVVVEPGTKTGMPIVTDNPREVGADRIANAVAAVDRYGAPALVVDFGTATTVDAVGPGGEYLGGAIAPGLEVSVDALVGSTAALRRVELAEPAAVIGRSTVEAMQSGVIYGYAGLVDGIVSRMEAELGRPVKVATGGLASTIVPHCRTVSQVDEFLTLYGLRLIYERNRDGR